MCVCVRDSLLSFFTYTFSISFSSFNVNIPNAAWVKRCVFLKKVSVIHLTVSTKRKEMEKVSDGEIVLGNFYLLAVWTSMTKVRWENAFTRVRTEWRITKGNLCNFHFCSVAWSIRKRSWKIALGWWRSEEVVHECYSTASFCNVHELLSHTFSTVFRLLAFACRLLFHFIDVFSVVDWWIFFYLQPNFLSERKTAIKFVPFHYYLHLSFSFSLSLFFTLCLNFSFFVLFCTSLVC